MTLRVPRVVFPLMTVVLLGTPPLRADITKDQCIDANAKGQDYRRDGKLLAAGDLFRTCAASSCPTLVREDCTRRLDEIVRAQPSFVFDVKDDAGGDLIAVKVSVDGQLLVDHLDGKPLKVDPGAHTLGFEVAGRPPVTRRLLVKEGEAGRQEHVVIDTGARAQPAPTPGAVPPVPPTAPPAAVGVAAPGPASSSGLGTQRAIGVAVAGVGVVGVGLGIAFGLLANSAWSDAKNVCGGNTSKCLNVTAANTDHDSAVTDGAVSTVGFIAGGVLIAGGAVLFLTGGHHEAPPLGAVSLAPAVGPGQAGVSLRGVF